MALLFAGLYRLLPVAKVSLRRALLGGLGAALVWRFVGMLMAYYVTNLSSVNVLYGSMATVVVVLLFLEVAFIILLVGAQAIAELERSERTGFLLGTRMRETSQLKSPARKQPSLA